MNNTLDELMGEIQSSNLDYCPESLSQFNNDLEEEKKSNRLSIASKEKSDTARLKLPNTKQLTKKPSITDELE